MPDISMCAGGNCPKKQDCYRYTAKPSQYMQSYFSEVPYNIEEQNCDYFWDNSDYKERKKNDPA
jgi:hypothetical protein